MALELNGIDHLHVYVDDLQEAENWYAQILGVHRAPGYEQWVGDRGPLVMTNTQENFHLALFAAKDYPRSSVIAFGTSGQGLLDWKAYLEEQALKPEVKDHTLSVSMYFDDPYGNSHEITTHDRDYVLNHLGPI